MVVGDPYSYNSCIGSVYQTIISASDCDHCLIIYENLQQSFELIYFHVKTSMYMKHSHFEGCRILGHITLWFATMFPVNFSQISTKLQGITFPNTIILILYAARTSDPVVFCI